MCTANHVRHLRHLIVVLMSYESPCQDTAGHGWFVICDWEYPMVYNCRPAPECVSRYPLVGSVLGCDHGFVTVRMLCAFDMLLSKARHIISDSICV